jgi:hypothetical protein
MAIPRQISCSTKGDETFGCLIEQRQGGISSAPDQQHLLLTAYGLPARI